jgi:hypothetical protein
VDFSNNPLTGLPRDLEANLSLESIVDWLRAEMKTKLRQLRTKIVVVGGSGAQGEAKVGKTQLIKHLSKKIRIKERKSSSGKGSNSNLNAMNSGASEYGVKENAGWTHIGFSRSDGSSSSSSNPKIKSASLPSNPSNSSTSTPSRDVSGSNKDNSSLACASSKDSSSSIFSASSSHVSTSNAGVSSASSATSVTFSADEDRFYRLLSPDAPPLHSRGIWPIRLSFYYYYLVLLLFSLLSYSVFFVTVHHFVVSFTFFFPVLLLGTYTRDTYQETDKFKLSICEISDIGSVHNELFFQEGNLHLIVFDVLDPRSEYFVKTWIQRILVSGSEFFGFPIFFSIFFNFFYCVCRFAILLLLTHSRLSPALLSCLLEHTWNRVRKRPRRLSRKALHSLRRLSHPSTALLLIRVRNSSKHHFLLFFFFFFFSLSFFVLVLLLY